MREEKGVHAFQEILDRVARTGQRQEIEAARVPDVRAWEGLESRGCVIWVEGGRWWVLPPAEGAHRPAA